ncbi:MAG: PhoX family phosphatase [Pseudomonadota bacterium]
MAHEDSQFVDNDALHNDSEDQSANPSGNRPFAVVVQKAMSRRTLLGGSLAMAATSGFLAPKAQMEALAQTFGGTGSLVGFTPVTVAEGAAGGLMPTLAKEYTYQSLIPWGTPIEPGATVEYAGDPVRRPTSEEAALQIGIGHDGMWFFPTGAFRTDNGVFNNPARQNEAGMLCINHEFGRTTHVLGKPLPENIEDVRVMQHVHGVSVVAIELDFFAGWKVVSSPNSRRIHVNSPMRFSGPVAGSKLLDNPAGNAPLGTVNNCGSGPTPWGTYLTCEENFNGYFGASSGFTPTEEQQRYGFTDNGFGYGWHLFDRRFDLSDADFVNERHRFGYIVEIDPNDASQTPVKRTAMGRFKHEAVAIAENTPGGRIAAYMGDDQRFDYCYKYVSDRGWQDAIAAGESPLDKGVLYVAKFNDNGTGEWLRLDMSVPALAARFSGMDELLVHTRIAADIVGATPMDRPEWTTIGKDGTVFWTLTNNSRRTTTNAANPQAPNQDGHIIRTKDADNHLGTTFTWDIYILASTTRNTEGVFTDPDAAYADPDGRLFIGTDGGQPDGLQDQLVVFDTTSANPSPRRLLVGVNGDEITGWTATPDRRFGFVNLQHPGNGDPSATNFPATPDGKTIPRDATLVISRIDRGVVGS